MSKSFGVPGESARQQAEARNKRLAAMRQLEQREMNWEGGAAGEELTAEAIEKHCPTAVALHDRRMPGSKANIDHIVVVPSGVWVIDSKRMKGRVKVEDGKNGAQKLFVNGDDRTGLVHKLTRQVQAVEAALAGLGLRVPVYGGFCFWFPYEKARELFNPFTADTGLPLMKTWTINGYPLFYWRPMVRKLSSPGTMSSAQTEALAEELAERFPAAAENAGGGRRTTNGSTPPQAPALGSPTSSPPPAAPRVAPRLTKDEFKAAKAAERERQWEDQRPAIEAVLGCSVPQLLAEPLSSDGTIWCHPALWHARVYLACVHGRIGEAVPYTTAASMVAAHHDGRPGAPQWRALTAFLGRLRDAGYLDFNVGEDGRISELTVLADPQRSPAS